MTDTNTDEKDTHRLDVQPVKVELMTREVGSTGDGEVLARFTIPVLLCHDDATEGGWRVDGEAMKDDLMSQLRSWVIAATRPEDEWSE